MDAKIKIICQREIGRVARHYSTACWWMEFQELQQQGWIIALEVCENTKIKIDTFGAYLHTSLSRNLSTFCWKYSCVASDARRPGKHLKKITRCQFTDYRARPYSNFDKPIDDPEVAIMASEAAYMLVRLRNRLRNRFLYLYTQNSDSTHAARNLDASTRVLIDGQSPGTVAEECEMPENVVYRSTAWMKNRALRDSHTCRILAEIKDRRADLYDC